MVHIVEDEGGRLIDGCGARAGGRVRLGAGMDGKSVETVLRHGRLPIIYRAVAALMDVDLKQVLSACADQIGIDAHPTGLA